MSKGKKTLIVLSALLFLICAIIDIWYLVVYLYGDDKIISQTINIGLQETASGDEQQYFIELNYYSNANENGYEMFEVKFNYLMDETASDFYSQGLQYIGNDEDDSITFLTVADYQKAIDDFADEAYDNPDAAQNFLNSLSAYGAMTNISTQELFSKGGWYNAEGYFATYFPTCTDKTTTMVTTYQSDGETNMVSTNPIDLETSFRVNLDDDNNYEETDLYQIKFKGVNYLEFDKNEPFEDNVEKINSTNYRYLQESYQFNLLWAYTNYYYYFDAYDANYLSYILYNAVKGMSPGTNRAAAFEFGDMFNYYRHQGDGVYENIAIKDTALLEELMTSYYAIKINISADGAQKAGDSLFGMVKGSETFNLTGEYDEEYFAGRTVVKLDNDDFDLVNVKNMTYALKINEEVFTKYYNFRDNICLSIEINLDQYDGITVVGFVDDSLLNLFNITRCVTILNGEEVEVQYA